jgi:uncharacterized membrane protein
MSASKRFAAVLIWGLLFSIAAVPAWAEIRFCNKFSRTVFVSVAYAQPGYNSFISRGWLRLAPNACDEFDSAMHLSVFYYYAETDAYSAGPGRTNRNTWGALKADKRFWVADNSFNIFNNPGGEKPDDPGAKLVGFTRSIERSDGELSETLTIEADGVNVTQSANFSDK